MVQDILYYPDDQSFPLVDMYYGSGLVGIQATTAKEHAKNVSVYQSFYDKISTSLESMKLKLYYLIMPCNIRGCQSSIKFYLTSSFFLREIRLFYPKKSNWSKPKKEL